MGTWGSDINNVNTDRCFTHLRHMNLGPKHFSNVLYKLWIYIGPTILYNPIQNEYDTNGTPYNMNMIRMVHQVHDENGTNINLKSSI